MSEKFVNKAAGKNENELDVERFVILFRLRDGAKLENVNLNIFHTYIVHSPTNALFIKLGKV